MLGDRIGISQGGVGSALAALSTVLPETIILIIAILGAVFTGRDPESAVDISIGAILHAPFLMATLAMFLIGISLVCFRRRRKNGSSASFDEAVARKDLKVFIAFSYWSRLRRRTAVVGQDSTTGFISRGIRLLRGTHLKVRGRCRTNCFCGASPLGHQRGRSSSSF
jgi:Ca2+/Na+ antiporter